MTTRKTKITDQLFKNSAKFRLDIQKIIFVEHLGQKFTAPL